MSNDELIVGRAVFGEGPPRLMEDRYLGLTRPDMPLAGTLRSLDLPGPAGPVAGDLAGLGELDPDSPIILALPRVEQHMVAGQLRPVAGFRTTLRQLARILRRLNAEDDAKDAAR